MDRLEKTLSAAGLLSAEDRLEQITLQAMVKHAGSPSLAEDAIWEVVCKDSSLMQALLAPYRRQATANLFYRVRRSLGYNPAVGSGATMHIPSEDHVRPANSPLARRAQMVSIIWDREHKAVLRAQRDVELQWLEKVRAERLSWMDIFAACLTINEKPFWTVSVREAKAWITTKQHESRFIELVICGVPDDGRPISHYRTPDEMDALWEQARTV